MKSGLSRRRLAWLVTLIAVAQTALADAPCYAGYRDTTPAERTKMTAVLETVQSAMPAPPAGWVIGGDEAISVPQSLCQDYAKVPLDYSFTRYYRNVGDAEERQKPLMDQAKIEAEAYKKKQPRLEAIQAKMEKLVTQQVALLQKGDLAGAEKYNAQIATLQEEYQKIADEGSDPAAMDAIAKESNRDLEMTIRVNVNPMTARTPAEAKPIAPPAGAKSAFRWHVEDESQSNDHALYFFGAWFKRPDGALQPSSRSGVAFSAAHGLTLEVAGDPARVTQTVAAIDFAKIAALTR
jgi:hypothetical protein